VNQPVETPGVPDYVAPWHGDFPNLLPYFLSIDRPLGPTSIRKPSGFLCS
jgi:hypothetical protein